jgi:hypothetical protein
MADYILLEWHGCASRRAPMLWPLDETSTAHWQPERGGGNHGALIVVGALTGYEMDPDPQRR